MASEWFYAKGDQKSGPVTLEQLQSLASSGQLQPSDLVWKDGMNEWTPASGVSELSSSKVATASPPQLPTTPPQTTASQLKPKVEQLRKAVSEAVLRGDGADSAAALELQAQHAGIEAEVAQVQQRILDVNRAKGEYDPLEAELIRSQTDLAKSKSELEGRAAALGRAAFEAVA
ncbi:MAG: DUF4339 domain-containing protein, partial [Planctomycetota bacterium]|nr:DUF4339 domain-containing protein [Planctomycetota bacterium]